MTLSEELLWRGFVQDATFVNLRELDDKRWTFYHGFDASADSQTIGNLAGMMLDRVFLRHGHRAILLAGGATTLIGDPGGKEKEREVQDESVIRHNVSMAEEQIKHVFRGHEIKLVNNLDWLQDVKLLPFLRDVGKHFAMTELVQRDYIATRIGGSGISYAEFSYTLLQGYDYLHLYDKFGCNLQLGGSDQWGNCISGVDLVRKARGQIVHAITLPLVIDKTTGKKFGKSEGGAIWLDPELTSVYRFYQFWLNTSDDSVEEFLKIFTELDKDIIDQVMAEFSSARHERKAQKTLAYEATKLVHGEKRTEEVVKVTDVLFSEGNFLELDNDEKKILKHEMPNARYSEDIHDVLVEGLLASSKNEARKFLASGAIHINGQKAGPENLDLFIDGLNLVKRGKNTFAIVEK